MQGLTLRLDRRRRPRDGRRGDRARGGPVDLGDRGRNALPAYLAGLPSIALSAVIVGAIADTVVAENAAPAVGELIFGAGLLAVGLVCRADERA